jgi:hypothetical protein
MLVNPFLFPTSAFNESPMQDLEMYRWATECGET